MSLSFQKRRFPFISLWLILGAITVLLPIFVFMVRQDIERQRENDIRLLFGKGVALIRSIEAGTRTGMMARHWGRKHLQNLLTQTAMQPDIVHLMIADAGGNVLAHNQSDAIGGRYGENLDLSQIIAQPSLQWRQTQNGEGKTVFEVYGPYSPTAKLARHMHQRMGKYLREGVGLYRPKHFEKTPPPPKLAIIVGLDMTPVQEARKADIQQTIWVTTGLLLAGIVGIVLLLLGQGYRATRLSLQQVQAFSDTLVESMPLGLVAMDAKEIIMRVNPRAVKILSLNSGSSATGQPAGQYLPPALLSMLRKLNENTAVVAEEISGTIGQRMLTLDASASSLTDTQGGSLGKLLLIRDISELKSLKREVHRNQRLAALGSLAGGLAHEIRNPLSSIKGFATFFKERHGENQKDRQVAEVMIQEVDRLNRVVRQLGDFARPVKPARRRLNLRPIVTGALSLIDRQAQQAGVSIHAQLPPQKIEAHVDPDQLHQVLLNLFLNSLEATDAGGRLTVTLDASTGADFCEILVADTGRGIAPEKISQVFDPYFTTKTTGTGLGLAIARNIIEAHDGEITIESTAGQGTTVRLLLPAGAPEKRLQRKEEQTS